MTVARSRTDRPISARPGVGADYLLLRDGAATAALTSSMFEIVSRAIPPWWTVHDPYGTGVVVIVGPEAWADPAYSIGRESQETEAFDTFRSEVDRMYAAEGKPSPF